MDSDTDIVLYSRMWKHRSEGKRSGSVVDEDEFGKEMTTFTQGQDHSQMSEVVHIGKTRSRSNSLKHWKPFSSDKGSKFPFRVKSSPDSHSVAMETTLTSMASDLSSLHHFCQDLALEVTSLRVMCQDMRTDKQMMIDACNTLTAQVQSQNNVPGENNSNKIKQRKTLADEIYESSRADLSSSDVTSRFRQLEIDITGTKQILAEIQKQSAGFQNELSRNHTVLHGKMDSLKSEHESLVVLCKDILKEMNTLNIIEQDKLIGGKDVLQKHVFQENKVLQNSISQLKSEIKVLQKELKHQETQRPEVLRTCVNDVIEKGQIKILSSLGHLERSFVDMNSQQQYEMEMMYTRFESSAEQSLRKVLTETNPGERDHPLRETQNESHDSDLAISVSKVLHCQNKPTKELLKDIKFSFDKHGGRRPEEKDGDGGSEPRPTTQDSRPKVTFKLQDQQRIDSGVTSDGSSSAELPLHKVKTSRDKKKGSREVVVSTTQNNQHANEFEPVQGKQTPKQILTAVYTHTGIQPERDIAITQSPRMPRVFKPRAESADRSRGPSRDMDRHDVWVNPSRPVQPRDNQLQGRLDIRHTGQSQPWMVSHIKQLVKSQSVKLGPSLTAEGIEFDFLCYFQKNWTLCLKMTPRADSNFDLISAWPFKVIVVVELVHHHVTGNMEVTEVMCEKEVVIPRKPKVDIGALAIDSVSRKRLSPHMDRDEILLRVSLAPSVGAARGQ